MTLDMHGDCPKCGVSWKGEPIPEEHRSYYSPPFFWSRAIGQYDIGRDRTTHIVCPDCHAVFER